MTKDTKTALGVLRVFGFLLSMVLAVGSLERAENLPTDQLTLAQPACQYLFQSGIGIKVKNGICSIDVKYRKNKSNVGGVIEQPNGQSIEISQEQVVAVKEIEEGSKDPWTLKMWFWLAWFLVSALGMLGSVFLINRPVRKFRTDEM